MGRLRTGHFPDSLLPESLLPSALLDQWATNSTATAMDVSGVKWNQSGDLNAFLSGLLVNTFLALFCLCAFAVLRQAYPPMFSHNSVIGLVSTPLPKNLWGWMPTVLRMTCEQRAESMGLDVAMAVEFHVLSARLMFTIGLPMFVIISPLHLIAGGRSTLDRLSRIGLAGLGDHHPWMYYLTAGVVWAVVLFTEAMLRSAHARFLQLRTNWLHRQPLPRASTIFVQHVPADYCSDARLREFFEGCFGAGHVREAHMLKRTGELPDLVAQRRYKRQAKRAAEAQWQSTGERPLVRASCFTARVDAIDHYAEELRTLQLRITEHHSNLKREALKVGGVNSDLGFVTFASRRDAEIAMALRYSFDREAWQVSPPPEPQGVDWSSLIRPRPLPLVSAAAGYTLVAALYLGFVPICIMITNLATLIDMGPLQPVWAAFAPTVGLLIFVSLLPTLLLWVFREFFTHDSESWAQRRLQDWYFWFQVFFVVLVTAIGSDFADFLNHVAAHPPLLFNLLADKMPYATHFYLSYLVLQWTTHALHLMRPANLARFLLTRPLFEQEEARRLSEPEDQGYYGLGSRCARWTTNAVVGLVFCTLSPLCPLLAGVDFLILRVTHGYLLVFAETRKNDLGGAFWVKQMEHMRVGLMIYCVLMKGVLAVWAPNAVPTLVVLPSLVYVAWCYLRFDGGVCKQGLPFGELNFEEEAQDTGEVYVQPELLEDG